MSEYKQAIKVLEQVTDWRHLVFTIAAVNPSAVVAAFEQEYGKLLENKIKQMHADGYGKIPCIKYYREVTSVGLREAKEAIEQICPEWHPGGSTCK